MGGMLGRAYGFVRDVLKEFAEDRGSLFAAAIAFYALISLIPLLLLGVAVFGHIIGSEHARQHVITFAKGFMPVGAEELQQNLRLLSRQSRVLGGIGLLGLWWIGSQVFVILQQVMNIALGSTRRVGFLRARATAFATVVIVGLLFALSLGLTSLLTLVRGFRQEVFGIGPDDVQFVWQLAGILVPFIISFVAFWLMYRFLPLKDVGMAGPLIGGLTAGVLFEIAKYVFRWYVTHIADYDRIYGSLGGAVVLVLWIYYVSLITVLGAEIASVYARRKKREEG